MDEVVAEMDELAAALREFEVTVEPVLVEDESKRWVREQRRYMQANGPLSSVEFFPESRQQKQAVIAQVRNILKAFGSMQVREIHGLLRTEEGDVPSLPRLSQILSESQEFEADRSKGWSLKE
jgi:hypothetical protein